MYNVNNLKLARYKEIFPAPAKTDAIDARRMLELFAFDGQRSFGRDVLQEVAAASQANASSSTSPLGAANGWPIVLDTRRSSRPLLAQRLTSSVIRN